MPVLLAGLVAPWLHEHPADRLGPANQLTLARAVMVALMAAFLGEPAATAYGLPLAFVGGLAFGLDWLDGRIARATGWSSPFGARLDMELDSLFVMVTAGLLWSMGYAGAWVLLAGLARYAFIAAGWAWPWMAAPLPETPRRAIACGVGITFLLGALVPWPWLLFSTALAALGTLTILGSFAIDVAWLARPRR